MTTGLKNARCWHDVDTRVLSQVCGPFYSMSPPNILSMADSLNHGMCRLYVSLPKGRRRTHLLCAQLVGGVHLDVQLRLEPLHLCPEALRVPVC